jgi:hypothetical protein
VAWGLAEEIVVQGHDRKTCGDGDRVDPADRIDQWRIFLVAASEGLEGALEAVDQVYGQGEDTDEVDGHDPDFLEGDIDAAVDILHGFVMAGVGDHGELVCKAHLDPEVAHVEAEEGEDEDAEEGHVLGGPGGAGDLAGLIVASLGDAVGAGQDDALDGVEEDAGVEADRDDLDKGVVRHKCRVDIERFAAVIREELEVAGHVDGEEEDQEDAGEAHDHFLAQGRGKETGYPVHNRSAVNRTCKIA